MTGPVFKTLVGLFDDQWMKLWSEWSNGDRVMVRLMIED
jgi:hypothetical protein